MKEVTHIRKGHTIKDIAADVVTSYKSINEPKRASRAIGGAGVVRTVPHKQKAHDLVLHGAYKNTFAKGPSKVKKEVKPNNKRPTTVESSKMSDDMVDATRAILKREKLSLK